ncbi:hypothetical protein AQ916_06925 [Burkholderia pseudomallei]|uniref:hypothetical protein n=1 Tax=Burkholderia pseudomallei TaxID=28450 RepID=UPI000976F582|nr:hypothetical protein [Burkholderia pseudomallei]ONC38480.1 hypothetical protein AQ916_06925 [Burkholderia pseudomallei]
MDDQQQSRADALTDEHIATLKLAARAVTPQDIDGAERIESRPDGSYIICPACEGEGCIPFESDYCNYDHVAIGVQFYGVGTEPGAAEAYFRAAKPATILALLDRLERAESALAAPPVEQPAAAPADERAALPQIPDLVKATAWLTMCLRTELSRLDDDTHKALDEVEAQLSCVRAITNGAIDYEAMVAARAAASPAAEAVALTDEGIIQLFEEKADVDLEVYHGIAASTVLSFARALLAAPQPAQAASPAAERVTDALQALSADVHTLGDGWANDEAMIGLAKKYLRVEPKPASPELSLWRDFVLLAVTDTAPQPAQADAPAEVREALNEVLFGNDESLEMAADALDRLGQDSAAAGVRAVAYELHMLAHKMRCAPADAAEARLTDAARDMLAERRRQVEAEGWTPEHDDQYQHGAIALAAACYAANAGGVAWADPLPSFWPWMHNWWKPTTPRRDLVKAGALILAELERLDRAALLNGADHDR